MTITGKDGKQTRYRMRIESCKKGGENAENGGAGSRKGNLKPDEKIIRFAVRHRSAKPRHYKKKRAGGRGRSRHGSK